MESCEMSDLLPLQESHDTTQKLLVKHWKS